MELNDAFDEIYNHTHLWNWGPDWIVLKKVYLSFPESFSILTPFAYSYLEELIRSTTSEYGRELVNTDGKLKKYRKVGTKLIYLAIEENKDSNPEFVEILPEIKSYFSQSDPTDTGDNRNSVAHGFMHPRFWNQDSFEKLIFDIAKLSKHARF
ncbi:hypothetical protein [Zobellia roscoffensis]|uniref:hypothetical protein n=1 Tax=Zobellia roscoffensis TaxID=2779508 RepID=UPI00188B9446|nr:hypothetical protein [Zobellia roscoffensis]